MVPAMSIVEALGSLSPQSLCLVGVLAGMFCMTTYFIVAHTVNQVVAHAKTARFPGSEIQFREPKE